LGITIDRLEAVVRQVLAIEPEPAPLIAGADACGDFAKRVLTKGELGETAPPLGDIPRQKINGTADGLRAINDRRRPFEDAHRTHAADERKEVGCRRRVGGWSKEYAIFHERNLLRAIRVCSAHADVRPKPHAIFPAHINAGDAEKHLVGIVVAEALQLLICDGVHRATRLRLLCADDANLFGLRCRRGCRRRRRLLGESSGRNEERGNHGGNRRRKARKAAKHRIFYLKEGGGSVGAGKIQAERGTS